MIRNKAMTLPNKLFNIATDLYWSTSVILDAESNISYRIKSEDIAIENAKLNDD